MESLPGEMIAEIGRYLSVADLAACSATCRTWREKFNDDRIWRRRCTLRLAEYLENTDTTVSPDLQLTEHDSLSPLSMWHARFIRENHLWNNWREGYYKVHQMACIYKGKIHTKFYKNDYVVMVLINKVKVWDVRDVPSCLLMNPCKLDPAFVVDYFQFLSEDRIIFMQSSKVSVFRMSVTSSHWPLIHSFYFDERLSTEDFSLDDVKTRRPREDRIVSVLKSYFYTVSGEYFIGVAPESARLVHIWNIKTGGKLKEVICPVSNPDSYFTKLYHAHNPSSDVVLVALENIQEGRNLRARTHLYVYNLSELRFRDFTHCLAGRGSTLHKCMIYEPYIFIKDYFFLSIYNYKTTRLIDIKPAVSIPIVLNGNVIYVTGGKFMQFNVSTGQTNQLSTFNAHPSFTVACDRFITQYRSSGQDFEVLEVSSREMRYEFSIQPNNSYWLSTRMAKTNAMCTKKIIIEFDLETNKRKVYIINFW
ncbi:uncharacterized protein LOC124358899 isoform X2 [Homalodisca vitripennis]|uniref:uncharacterized protein LOC124358899 isoform X2 n=1 Tax=Homalodisca vitripennis TaxID=197043 RepID=UPI001EECA6E9|nr:uncharacterized protein LOC124358899 isoform X2 [Homalodisca vitripennis]